MMAKKIFLSSNIKFLRNKKGLNQQEMALELNSTRVKLNSYENKIVKNPPLDDLLKFADYFLLNVDTLLKVDLTTLSEKQLNELQNGQDSYIKGTALRVLTSNIDGEDNEQIEMVSVKAKAGYLSGFNDPSFIEKLPVFQLPFLSKQKKYRTFQLDGDSMYPIPDKAYVVTEFVQNWYDIKDGTPYIILTQNEGIVFKVAYNHLKNKKSLLLHSYNPLYPDYEVKITEVREVWKFVNYFTSELPDTNFSKQAFLDELHEMEKRINHMKSKLA